MVICCGRLVVVSSIPPGDFLFIFLGEIAVFGCTAPCGSGFWWIRKSDRRVPPPRSWWGTPTLKAALLARETARFACAVWALGGAFLGVRADSSRRTWRILAVMWHFGRLTLSNTSITIALGGQTSVLVAARPKKRRFCRNGPNKRKRPKNPKNRGCLNAPPQ